MPRRRIVLCTDDSALAGRLYNAFRQAPDLHLAAEARPGEIDQTLAEQRPDACLMAHPLSRENGIDVAAGAVRRFPGVPVWLLTPTPTDAVRAAVRQAGLAGVIDLREDDLLMTADELIVALGGRADLPPESRPGRSRTAPPGPRCCGGRRSAAGSASRWP